MQELGQAEDTPDDIIFDHFQATAYPDQAIGRPVLGQAEIIERMSRESLIDYRQRRYGARNMVLVAAGAVDHDKLVELAAQGFADLPAVADESLEPAQYVGGVYRENDHLEQVHLVVGFPGVAYADSDYYSATVLATLLGGGMSSRLFQEIRERRGLCYSISAYAVPFLDGGIFGVYTGTGTREAPELVDVLAGELAGAMRANAGDDDLICIGVDNKIGIGDRSPSGLNPRRGNLALAQSFDELGRYDSLRQDNAVEKSQIYISPAAHRVLSGLAGLGGDHRRHRTGRAGHRPDA